MNALPWHALPLPDFHFLRPWWLLALPLLWVAALTLARQARRDGQWQGVIDESLLPSLQLEAGQQRISAWRQPWPWLAILWTLAVLALAGPSWRRDQSNAFRAPAAWVVVLDLSPTMSATDLAPDRVTRARYAIDDVLNEAHDARTGLIAFSEDAYTVAPLTDDVATVRALLPPLSPDLMPAAGDNLAPALRLAGDLLKNSPAKDRRVLVFSDGFADPSTAFSAAQALRTAGIGVEVIGVGTEGGAPYFGRNGFERDAQGQPRQAPLDDDRLKQLASAGGGHYDPLSAASSMATRLHAAQTFATAGGEDAGLKVDHWQDGGIWLLPALLVLAASLARRGWL